MDIHWCIEFFLWSPTKKKFYTPRMVIDDYGVPAHNFLMYKVLMGDKSDNIEGVKGLGPKKLPKILPDLFSQSRSRGIF